MTSKKNIFDSLQIVHTRLYEQIADQIERMIVTKELEPGEKLPPERELTQILGVSRPTIREATKVLRDRGLVELRPGSGTYVKSIGIDSLHLPIERFFINKNRPYIELMQIREVIEPSAAALAAKNASPEDLEELEKTIPEIEAVVTLPESYSQVDLKFHVGIVKATKNEMLLALLTPVLGIMREVIKEISAQAVQTGEQPGPKDHREIFECIKGGKVEDAGKAMGNHIRKSVANVQRLLKDKRA